jgi:hypothetical protein
MKSVFSGPNISGDEKIYSCALIVYQVYAKCFDLLCSESQRTTSQDEELELLFASLSI